MKYLPLVFSCNLCAAKYEVISDIKKEMKNLKTACVLFHYHLCSHTHILAIVNSVIKNYYKVYICIFQCTRFPPVQTGLGITQHTREFTVLYSLPVTSNLPVNQFFLILNEIGIATCCPISLVSSGPLIGDP